MVETFRSAFFGLLAVLLCTASHAEQVRGELELLHLDQLCLAATILRAHDQMGSLRDNFGRFHTIRVGTYVGRNHGRVDSISDQEVLVSELVEAGGGNWRERDVRIGICRNQIQHNQHGR
ncbi:MAG: pilus assembly protein PilP [Pseudomarimonas sp.]